MHAGKISNAIEKKHALKMQCAWNYAAESIG